MNAVESRFINDPVFHAVVCSMQHILEQYQLTPSEMRDAVMLACVNFEQRRSRTAVLFGAGDNCRLTHAAENGEAPLPAGAATRYVKCPAGENYSLAGLTLEA
jgi:hypothetical protein